MVMYTGANENSFKDNTAPARARREQFKRNEVLGNTDWAREKFKMINIYTKGRHTQLKWRKMDSLFELVESVLDENAEVLEDDWEIYYPDGIEWDRNPDWERYELSTNFVICNKKEWVETFGKYLDYIPCQEEELGFEFNADVELADYDVVVQTDGCSLGNPGHSGAGIVIFIVRGEKAIVWE